MSWGTTTRYASKKAFREAVAEAGAHVIMVTDTSMFDNKGTVPVAALVDTSAVIVGPDVHRDRRWYANVKRNAKTGQIVIV